MKAMSQANAPGSPSRRCTLHHQHVALGRLDRDARAGRRIRSLGQPQRVADAHLAAAVLDRLLDDQRAADVLLAAHVEIGQIACCRVRPHEAAHPEYGQHRDYGEGDDLHTAR